MDTEPQSLQNTDTTNTPPPATKHSAMHHVTFSLLSLLVLVVAVGTVYMWQRHKVTALSSQISASQTTLMKDSSVSLDNLTALKALPNIVVDSANSPTDLIAFLGADNTQCYKNGGGSGYYKVIAQSNDQFAKMQYGCTAKGDSTPLGSSPSYILAKKTNNKWSLVSPSNQWLPINGQDLPSCSMVNDNKISKVVTPQCWNGPALTGSGNFNLKNYSAVPVTNP